MTGENNKDDIKYFKSLNFKFETWKPSPALIDRSGFASHQYRGQNFAAGFFTIDPEGWTHDHCEICWKTFCENDDECEKSGFVCENQWICVNCYNVYIKETN